MELSDGSRIGVIGGGPAGSLVSYFLLEMAQLVDLQLELDIYEPRDYSLPGPVSCNMCGGIISESLVQMLALEGINLPPDVVQRGIDSYVLHTDLKKVCIRTPLEEMRIAALHRGSGPKGCRPGQWESFDGFLLNLACEKGAIHKRSRVEEIRWENGKPIIRAKGYPEQSYDLVVGSVGVNSRGLKLFQNLGIPFQEPHTTKTCILEIQLGHKKIQEYLGNSMHVFLLDIPRLEFAAIIPKGEYVTICMLGRQVDQELVNRFMTSPEVRNCLPLEWEPELWACRCLPKINLKGGRHIYSDRIVLVGDCGVSRLFKDGIGAAYRSAKACAVTAIFRGVSKQDFQNYYWPLCKLMETDNKIGKIMFKFGIFFRKLAFLRQAMIRMAFKEQKSKDKHSPMSMLLWNMFTGSAPYRDIFLWSLKPAFIFSFSMEILKVIFGFRRKIYPPGKVTNL